eukprot:6172499-Pleurochrysis_carterae.AAC.1
MPDDCVDMAMHDSQGAVNSFAMVLNLDQNECTIICACTSKSYIKTSELFPVSLCDEMPFWEPKIYCYNSTSSVPPV